MSKAGDLIHVLTDLEIDYSDLRENPENMVKKIVAKAKQISADLDKTNTMSELEAEFKAKAFRNPEARERAIEIKSAIMDLIVNEDAEVIACLIPMLSEVVQQANNQVRHMSMRSSADNILTKKHLHLMYIELKRGYDAYKGFLEMLYPDQFKNLPNIPSKSGNYGDKAHTTPIHQIHMDGVIWYNPYAWAKELGLEITHYMDAVDIIKANNYEIQGRKIRLEEV